MKVCGLWWSVGGNCPVSRNDGGHDGIRTFLIEPDFAFVFRGRRRIRPLVELNDDAHALTFRRKRKHLENLDAHSDLIRVCGFQDDPLAITIGNSQSYLLRVADNRNLIGRRCLVARHLAAILLFGGRGDVMAQCESKNQISDARPNLTPCPCGSARSSLGSRNRRWRDKGRRPGRGKPLSYIG